MAWASSTLSKRVPTVSLLSWRPIISVLVNIFLMTIFLVLILSVMHAQNWYAIISKYIAASYNVLFQNPHIVLKFHTMLALICFTYKSKLNTRNYSILMYNFCT